MRQMKDSGIEWIGEIPEEWKVCRIKNIYHERTELSNNGSERLLSVSEYYGVAPTDTKVESSYVSRAESLIGYKKCSYGDLVSNIMLAWKGSLGTTNYDGIVSPAYCVYKPSCNIWPKFYHYLFRTHLYRSIFRLYSKGIIDSRLRLYSPYFYDIKTFAPTILEQQRIATFLDKKCGEVDSMIVLQEVMISELQAYKQSVITEAVTHGLNPNVKMKNSGIEWIGDIPEQWDVTMFKRVCTYIKDGTHFSPELVEDGYPYITAGDVRGKGLNYEKAKKIGLNDYLTLLKMGCQPCINDVLLVKDGATTGRVGLMTDDKASILLSSVAMLKPNHKLNSLYLMYQLMGTSIQNQIKLAMAGAAMPRITLEKIDKLYCVLPKSQEQQSIANYLDTKCSDIDRLISLKQEKIESLKAYKQSIIYEYVTGKLSVKC